MTFKLLFWSILAIAFVVGVPVVLVWSMVDHFRGKGSERRGGGGISAGVGAGLQELDRILEHFRKLCSGIAAVSVIIGAFFGSDLAKCAADCSIERFSCTSSVRAEFGFDFRPHLLDRVEIR